MKHKEYGEWWRLLDYLYHTKEIQVNRLIFNIPATCNMHQYIAQWINYPIYFLLVNMVINMQLLTMLLLPGLNYLSILGFLTHTSTCILQFLRNKNDSYYVHNL